MSQEAGAIGEVRATGVILGPDGKVKGSIEIVGNATPEQVAAVFKESNDAGDAPDRNS